MSHVVKCYAGFEPVKLVDLLVLSWVTTGSKRVCTALPVVLGDDLDAFLHNRAAPQTHGMP